MELSFIFDTKAFIIASLILGVLVITKKKPVLCVLCFIAIYFFFFSYNLAYKCDRSIFPDLSDAPKPSIPTPQTSKDQSGISSTQALTNSDGKHTSLLPILEPTFNIRETAKQMLLLEDHLFDERKRCQDCILKHLYTIEALLDEGMTLDTQNKYTEIFDNTKKQFRNIASILENAIVAQNLGTETCHRCAQDLRSVRKPLVYMTAGMKLD